MNSYRVVILLAFVLVQVVEYGLRFLNLEHMKKFGMSIPPGFETYIDTATLQKTMSYTIEAARFSFWESLFGTVVLLVFLFGGPFDIYNSWIDSLHVSFVLKGVFFFLFLSYASTIVSLPFSLYNTFRIENKYGFNTMTPGLWAADFLKSLALSTVLTGGVLAGGMWIVGRSPGYWWLFVWGFVFAVSVFLMYIAPYVIEPLFNKFTPLRTEGLEDRIKTLMQKVGIRVSRVFTMDASKRSTHTNAYFSGIGKVKRIVLFDTLVQKMDPDEIIAVLAHEAGHWKKKHVLKMLVVFESLSLALIYVGYKILESGVIESLFPLRNVTFFSQLVVLAFLFSIISFPFTPLFSFFSRKHENEADRFAVELTSHPESLATSLIKLSRDNLSNLHPHPLYAKIYYSHPPVVERVSRIRGEI